jgi:hypothetical protein
MAPLVPELARPWSASATTSSVDKPKRDDEDARAEEIELEQLADRVVAARSVY